jgi:hypothetical protein
MTDAVLWLLGRGLDYTGHILTLGALRARASSGRRRGTRVHEARRSRAWRSVAPTSTPTTRCAR